jgi:two-component system OmpR family sensor kinase
MKPLPLVGAPSELRPFIASINGLLERMKSMMDRQRRFIADAAHELRTPITALGLQAENLAALDLSESARERLAALKEGMARTKHLLEQLLALARYDAGMSCGAPVVSLDGLVKDLVADMLPETERKGIDLGFALIDPVAARGESIMVTTMVRNLVDYAVRFSPSARAAKRCCRSRTAGPGFRRGTSTGYSNRSTGAAGRRRTAPDWACRS